MIDASDQVVCPPAPGKSKVLSLLRNLNDFPVLQSGHQQSRVSFVHSEQRSVGEDVPKDSSPLQRVVTFTFPRTLRRFSAQTARLDAFGEHSRVHLSRPRCSGPNGIESLQSQRRICRPEPSMVTPRTCEVLHRASVTSAVPARLGSFLLPQMQADISDSARLSPPS